MKYEKKHTIIPTTTKKIHQNKYHVNFDGVEFYVDVRSTPNGHFEMIFRFWDVYWHYPGHGHDAVMDP